MKKILVIEDEITVLENIKELLESDGEYIVFTAENGHLGINCARIEIPDLIISDIMMPEVDGYEVLNTLRNDETTSTIPFIFLSAKTEKSDQRLGMNLGADDYLTKPFTAEELFKTIKTRLTKWEEISTKSDEQLNELRLNIASTIPHELRTPLNGILASSQLLLDYYDNMDRDEINQIHQSINTSANRLNRLIINYLTYAEIELIHKDPRKLLLFKKESYTNSPSQIIENIFQKSPLILNREILFNLASDVDSIKIFKEHFIKIIDELAENAFKFSLQNSAIEVATKSINHHHESGNPKVSKKLYEISIKNFGRGMTPEQISKIGAYKQFDRKMHEQQGSGLGLVICKRLLQIYDGEFNIESIPSEYTNVIIKIPYQ